MAGFYCLRTGSMPHDQDDEAGWLDQVDNKPENESSC